MEFLYQIPNNITQPSVLIRYVDDLFCTFSDRNQLDNYFQSISNIHPNITFSKELETNNHLAYLDISINTLNGKFETSVFRKKTNTGLYTKWNSFEFMSLKVQMQSSSMFIIKSQQNLQYRYLAKYSK